MAGKGRFDGHSTIFNGLHNNFVAAFFAEMTRIGAIEVYIMKNARTSALSETEISVLAGGIMRKNIRREKETLPKLFSEGGRKDAQTKGKAVIGMKRIRKPVVMLLAATALFSCTSCAQEKPQGKKECYAIIAALDFEVELIKAALEGMEETELLSTPVYRGTIGGHEVVVMQCGMGKVSAGIGAQALIDKYAPDYVINSGCAGALAKDLQVGDVVISDKVVEWDLDLTAIGYPLGFIDALDTVEMAASPELAEKIASVISGENRVVRGMVVSGDQFVSTKEQRDKILENFPAAQCAEMEGAAVGQVCAQNKVPFCIIRSMSDNANGDSGVDYSEFSKEASEKSARWLIEMLKKDVGY